MRILDTDGSRKVDAAALSLGMSVEVLMENASRAIQAVVARRLPRAERIAVVCGPGSNGGDGYAVARHLSANGRRVSVYSTHLLDELSPAARQQRALLENLGVTVIEAPQPLDLDTEPFRPCDLLIDAIFGTGLSRPVEGRLASWIDAVNSAAIPVLSVDTPSGLDASSALIPGAAILADFTVSFFAPKVAHVLSPARESCGEVWVDRLGLPRAWIESFCLPWDFIRTLEVPSPRRPDSHKGSYGHLLVVGGSRGMAGAPTLSARAALRGGVGLVTLALPEPALVEAMQATTEVMGVGLASRDGRFSSAALPELARLWEGRDLVVLGPGIGRGEELSELVREAVLGCPLPMVLDADGIQAFAGRARQLRRRSAATVLTPHPGELASLLGREVPRDGDERSRLALEAATETQAVVVLKGHGTLTARPDGRLVINSSGNPGMATAGSGDVLAGIIAAEWLAGADAFEAAARGVFRHGLAGDLAAAFWGEAGVVAGDLIDFLPRVRPADLGREGRQGLICLEPR